jgi:DNA repair exonuclease SbcCD ATPase subunit
MTDNKTMYALQICKERHGLSCRACPFYNENSCVETIAANAFDLINRKQAEIEKLTLELEGIYGGIDLYKLEYDNAQAEIERLKEGLSFERERVDNIPNLLLQAKSEVIKEYIERASIKLADNAHSDYWRWIEDTLHEVERDMVGESK